jgi:hypothetical protein
MPSAIDAPIFRPAQRVSSVPSTQSIDIDQSTPVLHSTRMWRRWLSKLGQQRESAMDRLAREDPYWYILAASW